MQAKEYLSEIKRLQGAIQRMEWERDALYTRLYGHSVSYDRERVQAAGSGDAMAAAIAKVIELDKEITAQTMEYFMRMDTIRIQIENLPGESHTRLLFKRYVQGKSLEKIAEEMSYTYEHARRLHGQALRAFGEKYEKEIENYAKLLHNVT